MVYNKDKLLDYLMFDEGLVNKVSGGYTYEYHLKDHLGNTRVTFQPNGSTITTTQVAEYYPFGSNYLPVSPAGTNKYLYNGKEKQNDVLGGTALDWYDYGARFYDPIIGRWHAMDPLMEAMPENTPYNYCVNNPFNNIDPNGQFPLPIITGAIGGVVGGLVAGGISAINGGSWKDVGIASAGGFVGGFIIGSGAGLITGTAGVTTLGAIGINATAGGLSGAATSLTTQGIEVLIGERIGIDGMEVVSDALIGIPANLIGSSITNAAKGQIKKEAAGQLVKETKKTATKEFQNSIKREVRQNTMLSKKQVNQIAKETIKAINQNKTSEINAARVTLQGAATVGTETVIQTTTNTVDERTCK